MTFGEMLGHAIVFAILGAGVVSIFVALVVAALFILERYGIIESKPTDSGGAG